jgi:starch-binding outer membrane protein, SusD/RagB family
MFSKYQKFLPVLLVICFFAGCDPDLLETVPNDRISSEIFWQTEQDAELAANAVYTTLDGLNIVGYDGITDLVLTNRGFDANVVIQRGQMSADTDRFLNEWNSAYTGIRRANDFMDNIDRVDGDTDTINRLTGEVRTLRAYHYIKLAMLFGDVPLITTGIDIAGGRSLTRTSVNEVWDFIASELDQAASVLPWQNNHRINRGAAYGLKARAMLYAGRYTEAAESALNVIQSGEYELYPDYYELFQYGGQGNSEILLARERARDFNAHNVYNVLAPWSQIPGSNGSIYVPTAAMIDKYEMDNGLPISHPESGFDPFNPYENRDPRLYASVFLNNITEMPDGQVYGTTPGSDGSDAVQITVYSTITGYNIRKYVAEEDYGNPGNSGLNTTLLRFAEILLTYAEAKIELNEIDQSVYDAINRVRQRPTVEMPEVTPATAPSQNELRERVRNERTIELAFEGFRLFDIRRWEIAEDVIPGVPEGITYVVDGELRQVEIPERAATFNANRDYLWPIPIREIELNSNLAQNPGW